MLTVKSSRLGFGILPVPDEKGIISIFPAIEELLVHCLFMMLRDVILFENALRLLNEPRFLFDPNIVVMLIGNKSDLHHRRAVSTEEGQELAERESLYFMETSALEATNVDNAFIEVLTRIHQVVRRQTVEAGDEAATSCVQEQFQKPSPISKGETINVQDDGWICLEKIRVLLKLGLAQKNCKLRVPVVF